MRTKQFWWKVILVGMLVLGIVLRFWRFEVFPIGGETQDETAWTMLGASLLQTGEPHSWSHFAGYEVEKTLHHPAGGVFSIVTPALDHPPLFSLLPGVVHTLQGESWDSFPSFRAIRFPMVLLSSVNLFLFGVWARRFLEDRLAQVFAIALAATAPSWVFLSRLVVSENLLVTLLLGLLILQTDALPVRIRKIFYCILPGALSLTKVAGISIAVASIFVSILRKRREEALVQGVGLAIGLGLWLLYAAVFDWSLFLAIQTQQAARDTGLLTFFSAFWWSKNLVLRAFADIWNWVGMSTLLFIALLHSSHSGFNRSKKKWVYFLLFALGYLAFLLLSTGEHTIHGWYRIPLWPLFAAAIGAIVSGLYRERNLLGFTFLSFLMLIQVRLAGIFLFGSELYSWQSGVARGVFLLTGLVVAGFFLSTPAWRERIFRTFFLFWILLVFFANILTIVHIEHQPFYQDALYLEQGIRP